jgi:hypothetical protein
MVGPIIRETLLSGCLILRTRHPPVNEWACLSPRIYAQPPDVHPELMGPPRRLAVKVSGLSRKLVQDPRFLKADAQLLHEIEQNLVETLNLSHSEADRLGHLILKIDLKKPENTSESDRKEIRKLLRQAVHDR